MTETQLKAAAIFKVLGLDNKSISNTSGFISIDKKGNIFPTSAAKSTGTNQSSTSPNKNRIAGAEKQIIPNNPLSKQLTQNKALMDAIIKGKKYTLNNSLDLNKEQKQKITLSPALQLAQEKLRIAEQLKQERTLKQDKIGQSIGGLLGDFGPQDLKQVPKPQIKNGISFN